MESFERYLKEVVIEVNEIASAVSKCLILSTNIAFTKMILKSNISGRQNKRVIQRKLRFV
ncbi:MAG: hypothetical protein ACI86M_002393 [Saprospiraceae bacterium]|jgi:hypothetical protein